MRVVFGVVSLLIVLAIVGMLAKTQLRAVGVVAPQPAGDAASTVPQQAQQIQQRVRDDVTRALQQGAERSSGGANPNE